MRHDGRSHAVEAAPAIESLDDAVTLHIFSYLRSTFTLNVGKADLLNMACLGRCRCVSQREHSRIG